MDLMALVSKIRTPAKVLIFAHVPPPHHGQSYMVQLMLNGFGGDHRKVKPNRRMHFPFGVACYHVNARVSQSLEDIGYLRIGKFLLLIGYCLQAIWCHFRFGIDTFYYVPAPGKKSALFRDWLVMFFCRPFFKHVILHWHAAGLAKWLETVGQTRARSITFSLMKNADLSIVLSNYNRADAEKLFPKRTVVLGNGIPDPCPNFHDDVLPRRNARARVRTKLLAGQSPEQEETNMAGPDPYTFKVLFLGHCTREKGLFDAIDGVSLANAQLSARKSPIQIHLTVAGSFMNPDERAQYDARVRCADLQIRSSESRPSGERMSGKPSVSYAGFVTGDSKQQLLSQSDCLCFPTYHYAESFGLVLVEAMAFGLTAVVSRWRSIPELLPPDHTGFVDIRSPQQIAEALIRLLACDSSEILRERFLEKFDLERYLSALAATIAEIQSEKPSDLLLPGKAVGIVPRR